MKPKSLKPGNILTTAQNRRGATAVIVAICLFMLIGFAALAIDVGYLYTTRNELQNVADSGALAGAGYLGSIYASLSYSDQQGYTFNRDFVVEKVNEVTQKNKAAGVNITINNEDVIIGNWNGNSVDLTLTQPDAVQVTARRDGSANGPITTFLIRIFGTDTANVNAVATAALTGPANVEEGELKTPFGLSECVFPNDCKDIISFSPTTESCAAWHNFFDAMNASSLESKMLGLIQGDSYDEMLPGPDWLDVNFDLNKTPEEMVTPIASTGDFFEFKGGVDAKVFTGEMLHPITDGGNDSGNYGIYTLKDGTPDYTTVPGTKAPAPFPALFDYFKYRDDDGNDSIWTATVPVYKDEVCCINPSGSTEIVGFAKIVISMPNPPPDNTVTVKVDCNISFITGRGGGGISGNLKGIIPNLVK